MVEAAHPATPLRPVTVGRRLGRAAAGFCLGWVWCSVASLLWVGALAVGYGGLDRGLSLFKDEWWAPIGFAAYFGSVAGGWVGGTVGPAGLGPSRSRRPVLGSSLLGGASGVVLGAAAGAAVGWLVQPGSPQPSPAVRLSLGLGALVGILTGWLAGRSLTCAPPA